MMDKAATLKKMDALYDKFVLPVEAEHYGEYVVVAEDGRMVFGASLIDADFKGREKLGRGTFTFKVGERAVGRLR
jgi:hypothetical protein